MLKIKDIPEDVMIKIRNDLTELYKNVHQKLSRLPQPCTLCGVCCHFSQSEHRLYATTIEFLYLFDKYSSPPIDPKKDLCVFLVDGKCTVRDRRMLGCRTYYRLHTREQRTAAEEIYQEFNEDAKKLHQKYEIEYSYQDCMAAFEDQFGVIE